MSIFKSTSATVNQGQLAITCSDNVDFSSLPSGSLVILDFNKIVVADSGTAPVANVSQINLREPYPSTLPNLSGSRLIAAAGVPALVDAVNKVNIVSGNLTATKGELQALIDSTAVVIDSLSNVDNTSDADKPVSTAQQTSLDLKADRSSLNRKSLLDNPLCHLFKTNKLVETSAPTGTDSDITFTRASTATYVDRYGIVKTAAVNTIREEKDGFLIEQAGTNIATYSEQFDNAVWTKSGSTVITPNATTSPDGTVTADKIDFTNTSDRLFDAIVNTTAASFTFSIWVKSTGADRSIRLRLRNSPTTTNSAQTDFTATSEWQRFSLTLASLTENLVCDLVSISGDLDFYIWGAQLEQSLAATSYIPTVGSAVTRIADKALLPVLNNVVTKEFSIFGIISNKSDSTGGNKIIFRMPVASGFFTLFYTPSNNNFIVRYYGDSTPLEFGVISTENTVYFAITVDESNVTININGTESSASKLSDPSLVFNSIAFFGTTGSAVSNGNIKDFRIYDFALNANEIEYLLP
jgi:hypothetical protein